MGFKGIDPVRFGSLSMVTASLGDNDPALGTVAQEDGLEYVFVYNAGGEQINPGYGCVPNSASAGFSVTVSSVSSADVLQGVVKHATLTTDTYGWVVTKGVVPVEVPDNAAALAQLELEGNGAFVPGTARVCGKALAAIASGASGNAFIVAG
jgi:hypothetical protein